MESLLNKRLILVTGKGGVGRSTVAAAIALCAARRGRRTLLYEANANDRFGGLFDKDPVGTDIVQLAENLHAVNTNPSAALEEYGLMVLRFKRVYRMVFENRVMRYFLRAIPGLDDYSILGKAWYHTTEMERGRPVWDTLVFDMPASGHTMTMLNIPKVITETVPDGPLTRDAHKVSELLRDPKRTGVVLVTLAEEMPTNEACELAATMSSRLGIPVSKLVVNQVYPERIPHGSVQANVLDALIAARQEPPAAPLQALAAHAHLHRTRRALNARYLGILRDKLGVPVCELPFLFVPAFGHAQLKQLASLLG